MGAGDRHVFIADMSFLQWVLVSGYFCLESKRFSRRILFEDTYYFLLGLIGLMSLSHCWGQSLLSAYVSLRNAFGLNLSSLKAAPVQLSLFQSLRHGSLQLACLRALGRGLLDDALLRGHHSQSCCRKHSAEAVFARTSRADGGARRR